MISYNGQSIKRLSLDDPYYREVNTLAGRVLLNNFMSIHTSSFATTHVILDLVSAKQEYVSTFRTWRVEQARSFSHGEAGQRSARIPASQFLRCHGDEPQGCQPERRHDAFGSSSPGGGGGTMVCGPSHPVLHDPDIYPEPYTFKPFRFAGTQPEEGTPQRLDLTRTRLCGVWSWKARVCRKVLCC